MNGTRQSLGRRVDVHVATQAGVAVAAAVAAGAAVAGFAPGVALELLVALVAGVALAVALKVLPMPVPVGLMALWTGAMIVGGRSVAQLGPGPIYPTEVVFACAAAALAWRWLQAGKVDRNPLFARPGVRLAVAVFFAAFVIALLRGVAGYGHAALRDAGLGYPLLVVIVTWWLRDDRRLQDAFFRVWYVASFVAVVTAFLVARGTISLGPQSYEVGFDLLIALAPLLDRWIHGELGGWGKLWVVVVPVGAAAVLASRSGLWSIVIGAIVIAALNMRMKAARFAVALLVTLGAAGVIGIYSVDSPLVTGNKVVQDFNETVTLAPTAKGNDATWRLDAASQLLSRSVKGPSAALFGSGFGRPSNFVVFGEVWDTRTGGGGVGDVTVSGPHDGVVDIIYRLGWPAGIAFVALILALCSSTLRCLRSAAPRDARPLRCLLAIVVAGFFTLVTSDGLRSPQFSVLFACALALLAARNFAVLADAPGEDHTA